MNCIHCVIFTFLCKFFWRAFFCELYDIKSLNPIQIICTQLYNSKYSLLIQIFYTQLYGLKYSYLIQIIGTQLYGFKYSYLIQIICTQLYNLKYSLLIQIFYSQLYVLKYSYLIQIIGTQCNGRGVMVKARDCGIVVREFVLQSCYYVNFRANTLGKGMTPLSSHLYGLNSTTTVLLGEWVWH